MHITNDETMFVACECCFGVMCVSNEDEIGQQHQSRSECETIPAQQFAYESIHTKSAGRTFVLPKTTCERIHFHCNLQRHVLSSSSSSRTNIHSRCVQPYSCIMFWRIRLGGRGFGIGCVPHPITRNTHTHEQTERAISARR